MYSPHHKAQSMYSDLISVNSNKYEILMSVCNACDEIQCRCNNIHNYVTNQANKSILESKQKAKPYHGDRTNKSLDVNHCRLNTETQTQVNETKHKSQIIHIQHYDSRSKHLSSQMYSLRNIKCFLHHEKSEHPENTKATIQLILICINENGLFLELKFQMTLGSFRINKPAVCFTDNLSTCVANGKYTFITLGYAITTFQELSVPYYILSNYLYSSTANNLLQLFDKINKHKTKHVKTASRYLSSASRQIKLNSDLFNKLYHSNVHSNSSNLSKSFVFGKNNKGIRIAHLNIQHALPKMDELKYHLSSYKSNMILGLSETFLTDNVKDKNLQISDFVLERKDRMSGKKGGGLLVYISKNVPYLRRLDIESKEIESLWIQVNLPRTKPFLVIFVYRPPNVKQEWIKLFESQFDKLDCTIQELYILGDMNIDYSPTKSVNKYNNSRWELLTEKLGIEQCITTPTRITKSSSTIIDHVYYTMSNFVRQATVASLSISDHYPVSFVRSNKRNNNKHNEHEYIQYRCYKHFDENSFRYLLHNAPLHIIDSMSDPNDQLQELYYNINNILSAQAPVKIKRVKRTTQPGWITEEIKMTITERNKLHVRKEFGKYKQARNKVNSLIKKSKKAFYNNAIKNHKNTSDIWKTLKTIKNSDYCNYKESHLPKTLQIEDTCIDGKENILNGLNEYFINISNIVNKTDIVNENENFTKLEKYANEKLSHRTFDIELITPLDVKLIIDKLDSSKSTGLDGFGPKLIKNCGDCITPAISKIINTSITHGSFPHALKEAYVIPIFKGGVKSIPGNYRPISILNTISKIFERHISNQLQHFFKTTNILHETQSGFREQHSCHTALTRLIDTWLKEIDNGKYVGAVFLDLRKAFDLVDHRILLHKLKLYHFSKRSINLFESYLCNRTQVVKSGNTYSKALQIKSGVPQGSIIGPLLFLLYINDIGLSSQSMDIDLFADDSTTYASDHDLHRIEVKLQSNIDHISKWCKINNMSLHPLKTKCMIISTSHKQKRAKELDLTIQNTAIDNVQVHKLLGVTIDNTLSWKYHISNVCKNLNSKIALLKQIIYFLSYEMKLMFYNSYLLPCYDYCCTVWGKGIKSKTELNKTYKIQKRAAKIILNKPLKTNSLMMFKKLDWLSFQLRCNYHIGVLIFKCKNNLAPTYMKQLLTFSQNEKYNLRSSARTDIIQLKPKTNYMKDTFNYSSITIWNNIPLEIKQCSTLSSFKKRYKKLLYDIQWESL